MFRSARGDEHLAGGQGVPSGGLESQESSWIGLLFAVSRPAMSFLQRYLPGWPRSPARSQGSFVCEERDFLRQLDDVIPLAQDSAPPLSFLRCQHDAAAGPLQPPWFTDDSLREIGIQRAEEQDLNLRHQNQLGYLSSARTFLSHVWLSPLMSQEVKPGLGDWVPKAGGSSVKHDGGNWIWWGNFSGSEESSLKGLMSHLSWPGEENPTGPLCPQPALAETKAPTVFVQSGRGWMLAENPRLPDQKEQLAINGNLHTAQNREGSVLDQCSSITNHLSCPDAACPELSVLTPDLDNGYSSLEEEHLQMCRLLMVKAPSAVQPTETPPTAKTDKEEESLPANVEEEDEEEEERKAAAHYQSSEVTALTSSQCQNKAIAFIMGCPCSDDDSSQSDGESSAGDDDGFDSEGSSDLSESSDEDNDESSNSEADSETERFWSSLCRSVDPYSPRNFTAQLHTSSTPPRTIPAATPPSSNQSSPASSPDLTPLLLSSPPPVSDVWDESTSASEVDEAENLRLWSSFSCTSDPYSPLNFQAPLRTCGLVQTTSRARAKKLPHMSPPTPCHDKTSPSKYRMEEGEERLDSGFAEPSTFCRTIKKVRFCDHVEEFFASCGGEEEDRRGPWEELARDRCRFLRRCQEVEQSIAYCLQPQHRRQVYRRLAVFLDPEDVGGAGLRSTSLD